MISSHGRLKPSKSMCLLLHLFMPLLWFLLLFSLLLFLMAVWVLKFSFLSRDVAAAGPLEDCFSFKKIFKSSNREDKICIRLSWFAKVLWYWSFSAWSEQHSTEQRNWCNPITVSGLKSVRSRIYMQSTIKTCSFQEAIWGPQCQRHRATPHANDRTQTLAD